VLQNPGEGWKSPDIGRLEHINGDEPYCVLWARAHNTENAFIERFNKTYREEVLSAYLFDSLHQVRDITESWLREYNEERPHDSLGRLPPLTFMPRQTTPESTVELCA
jgi:hypothetical protein